MLSVYGLSISLFLWLLLLIFVYAHHLHTASEQVRLDAYTISLCHQRAHWLEGEIGYHNQSIARTQSLMDLAAAAALAAAIFGPEAIEAARLSLQSFAASAKVLEILQEERKLEYMARFPLRQKELQEKNDLEPKHGNLQASGFGQSSSLSIEREVHSSRRLTYERIFGVSWPKRLQKNFSFGSRQRFQYAFQGRRKVPLVLRPSNTFALKASQFAEGVKSGCRLESDRFLQRVKVIRDR